MDIGADILTPGHDHAGTILPTTGSLREDRSEIGLVPAAARDVWANQAKRKRCYHEDGRGRCRSFDTRAIRVEGSKMGVEWYCQPHAPSEASDGR